MMNCKRFAVQRSDFIIAFAPPDQVRPSRTFLFSFTVAQLPRNRGNRSLGSRALQRNSSNFHRGIAEKDPCAANVHVVGSEFGLATGIANRDRGAAVEQLKHS